MSEEIPDDVCNRIRVAFDECGSEMASIAMDFDIYGLDPSIYDEMFLPDGTPRQHCRLLYETLSQFSAEELGSIQERVTRSFSNEGILYLRYRPGAYQRRLSCA